MTVRHNGRWEAIFLLGTTLVAGCAHHREPSDAGNTTQTTEPTDTPAEQITMRSSLHRIYFATDSGELDEQDMAALDRDVRLLQRYPSVQVMIQGHTDPRGGLTHNLNLGELRAANVRKYLVDHGIDLSRVVIVSAGESEADAETDTPSELAGERRTDFILLWELPVRDTGADEAQGPR